MKYRKFEIGPYNLHIIKTDRFKVNRMVIQFKRKIKKEEVTIRNLLSDVLVSSTRKYNTQRLLNIKTEELYGMPYGSSTYLSGNYGIIKFSMEFLNDKYTLEPIFSEAINFMMDILFEPNIINDGFDEENFNIDKRNMENNIKSLSDNPDAYSKIKLLEELGDKSPVGYNSIGYLEDLEKITPHSLYKYYLDVIKKDKVDIFVIGDLDFDEVKSVITSKMKINTIKRNDVNHTIKHSSFRSRAKKKLEKKDIKQSKLMMGFKIKNPSSFEINSVSTIYSYILGGSADSLLFKNVREKHSLCYYVSSNIYRVSNIMIINSGIKAKDSNKVIRLIKKEIKKMSLGKFDDKYIDNGKEMFINACSEVYDTPSDLLNVYISNEYLKSGLIDDKKKEIMKVTKKDIMNFASKIYLDTIYILEGDDSSESE